MGFDDCECAQIHPSCVSWFWLDFVTFSITRRDSAKLHEMSISPFVFFKVFSVRFWTTDSLERGVWSVLWSHLWLASSSRWLTVSGRSECSSLIRWWRKFLTSTGAICHRHNCAWHCWFAVCQCPSQNKAQPHRLCPSAFNWLEDIGLWINWRIISREHPIFMNSLLGNGIRWLWVCMFSARGAQIHPPFVASFVQILDHSR